MKNRSAGLMSREWKTGPQSVAEARRCTYQESSGLHISSKSPGSAIQRGGGTRTESETVKEAASLSPLASLTPHPSTSSSLLCLADTSGEAPIPLLQRQRKTTPIIILMIIIGGGKQLCVLSPEDFLARPPPPSFYLLANNSFPLNSEA